MVAAQPPLAAIEADRFLVAPALLARFVVHARAAEPQECCGVGLGPVGSVAEFHELENVHETPVTRYEIDSRDQLRLHLRGEDLGWETTLVFHSHPATEPIPSATDRALAAWPDAVYAILSLAHEEPLLRAWHITPDEVRELEVVVADIPAPAAN